MSTNPGRPGRCGGLHGQIGVRLDEGVEDVLEDLEGEVRLVFWGSSWSGSPEIADLIPTGEPVHTWDRYALFRVQRGNPLS